MVLLKVEEPSSHPLLRSSSMGELGTKSSSQGSHPSASQIRTPSRGETLIRNMSPSMVKRPTAEGENEKEKEGDENNKENEREKEEAEREEADEGGGDDDEERLDEDVDGDEEDHDEDYDGSIARRLEQGSPNSEADFNRMTLQLEKQMAGASVGIKEMMLLQFLMFTKHGQEEEEGAIDVDRELQQLRERRKERLEYLLSPFFCCSSSFLLSFSHNNSYFAQKLDALNRKVDLAQERRHSSFMNVHPERKTSSPSAIAPQTHSQEKVTLTDYTSFNHPTALELFKSKPSKVLSFHPSIRAWHKKALCVCRESSS